MTNPLRYVGRNPDSDGIVVPKGYADTQCDSQAVTEAVVTTKVNTATINLVKPDYVDSKDDLRAQKTDVTAADLNYVDSTQLGVTVAQLTTGGLLPASTIPPGIVTDRVARCYSVASPAGALSGTPSGPGVVGSVQITGTHTVTTTIPREYQLATIPVPDPGFLWRPLPFAWVTGRAGGDDPGFRYTGNGNYGLLTVMPPHEVSDTVYGIGLCSGNFYPDLYPVVPYGKQGQTPTSVPPIDGALELRLYGSCWSGGNYLYSDTNLVYFVLVVPAL